ncbi:Acyl-coenzyme A oxidase [Quillaja saponaria]|uniref:Acyl-coenzyme A oxidase n=1 Tax=Quillaja saponaria TaxID=32244 RepID=A0AAD7QHG2_QUISA|nr:Acyl-coenzyme A oxidase [Quillaja saponaria]
MDRVSWRTQVLSKHLLQPPSPTILEPNVCLQYSPPELSETFAFDISEMRKLMDAHNLDDRDWLFGLMIQSNLFNPKRSGGRVFISPDYNQSMQQQREMTMKRIGYLLDRGVFEGWLTGKGVEAELRKLALLESIGIYDHSLPIKIGVHFFLWGGALGHGSNVRGIETVTTYDSNTEEFVINTPCESAQKYWIGGAANDATHTVVFSQLTINGNDQGVHAFLAQIRDSDGNICPNIRIADCGHKIGLNGVDNGRMWFENLRIPRENLLNSVADVSPDGQYLSAIKDPDQRFGAFLAPLTSGRVNLAVSAIYTSKISLAIAIRYSLTRRAFSVTTNGAEVLLLDYPSHQRRLLPLLAKTYAMSFAANDLKMIYVKRTPASNKNIHVVSSAFKATFTWHNMRTLQECREACGGQGLKTENRVGHLKGEYDVQSTFEGDNNVLMQQNDEKKKKFHFWSARHSLHEYVASQKKNKPFKGLGLEHMDKPSPIISSQITSNTLRSSQFQIDIFHVRERDLLNRFAAEVVQYQAQGETKESAFLLNYQLAEDLARAYTERVILKNFVDAEATVHTGSLKNVLVLLRSMYALICLEEDAAFLRYGYLSTENAASVRREVAKLCAELRPHALALVSSFGIPDALLSPIAYDWIEANSWSSVEH